MEKNITKNESKKNVFLSAVIAGYLSDVLDTLKNHIDGIDDVEKYINDALEYVDQTVKAVYGGIGGKGDSAVKGLWLVTINNNEREGDIELLKELYWDITEILSNTEDEEEEEEESKTTVSPAMCRLSNIGRELSVVIKNALEYTLENVDCYGEDLPNILDELFADIKTAVDERYGCKHKESWLIVLEAHEGSVGRINELCNELCEIASKLEDDDEEEEDGESSVLKAEIAKFMKSDIVPMREWVKEMGGNFKFKDAVNQIGLKFGYIDGMKPVTTFPKDSFMRIATEVLAEFDFKED